MSITLEFRRELEQAAATARAALGEDDLPRGGGRRRDGATRPAHRGGAGLGGVLTIAGIRGPRSGRSRSSSSAAPGGLSPREIEVLRLIAERQEQPGDRRRPGDQPEHRGAPRQQHLRQGRCRQPYRGRRLRPPPWTRALIASRTPARNKFLLSCPLHPPSQDHQRW